VEEKAYQTLLKMDISVNEIPSQPACSSHELGEYFENKVNKAPIKKAALKDTQPFQAGRQGRSTDMLPLGALPNPPGILHHHYPPVQAPLPDHARHSLSGPTHGWHL
jgi:predicted MPP superfamily phosphohydrolase